MTNDVLLRSCVELFMQYERRFQEAAWAGQADKSGRCRQLILDNGESLDDPSQLRKIRDDSFVKKTAMLALLRRAGDGPRADRLVAISKKLIIESKEYTFPKLRDMLDKLTAAEVQKCGETQ